MTSGHRRILKRADVNRRAIATTRRAQLAEYEALLWRCAEDPDLMRDPACAAMLFAAEKTLEDFSRDVQAIQKRIALEPEIAAWMLAREAKASLVAQREELTQGLIAAQREWGEKLDAVNEKINENRAAELAVKPAMVHFIKTAPQAMKNKLEALNERIRDLQSAARDSAPRPLITVEEYLERSPMLPSLESSERERLCNAHELKVANREREIEAWHAEMSELPAKLKAAERERDELTVRMLALRPE